MNRIGIAVLSTALVVGAAGPVLADDTFPDCTSASNYGWNTSWNIVSSSLNRAACDTTITERAEVVLAKQLRRQRIAAHNSEPIKACFYQGLYHGYVDALATEYSQCGRDLPLVSSVTRAAVAIFGALNDALDRVDSSEIDVVFDGAFEAPYWAGEACEYTLESDTSGDSRDELVASVCWND
jgi:hypothetical protein